MANVAPAVEPLPPVPTPATKEVSASFKKKVKKGNTVSATATCTAGMVIKEVLECSDTSSKFSFDREIASPSDGLANRLECRCDPTRVPFTDAHLL